MGSQNELKIIYSANSQKQINSFKMETFPYLFSYDNYNEYERLERLKN